MAGHNRREDENEEVSLSGVFKAIGAMAELARGARSVYNLVSSSGTMTEEQVAFPATPPPPKKISWSPPQKGWVKLNTDASVKKHLPSVGIGGLLRDYKGEWMWGFTGKLNTASLDITEAELRAMKEGLVIAQNMNLSLIVVETDSQAAIDLVQKEDAPKYPLHLRPLIQDCQKLLAKLGRTCRLQHTPWQGNRSADFLANRGHEEVSSLRLLHEPLPDRLTEILEEDRKCYGREKEKEEDSSGALINTIGAMAGLAMGAWGVYNLVSSSGTKKEEVMLESASSKRVSWSLPPEGWVKLNTDASVKQSPASVGIGGLLRDHRGRLKWGFAAKVDMRSLDITEAELLAFRQGLVFAWDMNLSQTMFETDSQAVIDLIEIKDCSKQRFRELIQDCKNLFRKPCWRLQHTSREGNRSADFLANQGHYGDLSTVNLFTEPPPGLAEILEEDLAHAASGRVRP